MRLSRWPRASCSRSSRLGRHSRRSCADGCEPAASVQKFGHADRMRTSEGLTLVLAVAAALVALALAGCATAPKHFPSETASGYLGKSLLALEMHWSAPSGLSDAGDGQAATWRFDQYNLAGCTVTVH